MIGRTSQNWLSWTGTYILLELLIGTVMCVPLLYIVQFYVYVLGLFHRGVDVVSPLVHELTYQVCCHRELQHLNVVIPFPHSRPWCMTFWVSKRIYTRKKLNQGVFNERLYNTPHSYQTVTEGGAMRSRDIILDGENCMTTVGVGAGGPGGTCAPPNIFNFLLCWYLCDWLHECSFLQRVMKYGWN